MEYAVTAAVIAFFAVIYLIMQPALREHAYLTCGDADFAHAVENALKNLPLPKKGGGVVNDKKYKKSVKKVLGKLKYQKTEACKAFYPVFAANRASIKEILKEKFDNLTSLPSIDKEARCAALARLTLAHSSYVFSKDRFDTAASAQNSLRTLTFGETEAFKACFDYVLLEKLAFLSNDITALLKMEKLAAKYSKDADSYENTPIFRSLKKNKLFISLCAERVGLEADELNGLLSKRKESIRRLLNNVFNSLEAVKHYDFSTHYSPLEILNGFSYFSGAPDESRKKLLEVMSELSESENLDELMYAERLALYARRAPLPHVSIKRAGFLNRQIILSAPKTDLRLLARCLTLPGYMRLFFGEKAKNKSKSIIENNINENSYGEYYEKTSADFGIVINNDKLKLNPRLDKNVVSASLVLKHNGVSHHINVTKGRESAIKLDDTTMYGVEEFKLGSLPLNVNVVISDENQ